MRERSLRSYVVSAYEGSRGFASLTHLGDGELISTMI